MPPKLLLLLSIQCSDSLLCVHLYKLCTCVCVSVDSCGETEQILSCAYVFFFFQDTVEKICIKEIGTKQRLVPKIQNLSIIQ